MCLDSQKYIKRYMLLGHCPGPRCNLKCSLECMVAFKEKKSVRKRNVTENKEDEGEARGRLTSACKQKF